MSAWPREETPEQIYERFWKPILEKDGVFDLEQAKKELSDFEYLIVNVPKVYMEVTRGRISKPMTWPEEVIAEHNAELEEDYVSREDVKELFEIHEPLDATSSQDEKDLFIQDIADLVGWDNIAWKIRKKEEEDRYAT